MTVENMTIGEYMEVQLLIDLYKDDEITLQKELIKKIDGNLKISKREGDEILKKLTSIVVDECDFIQRFEFEGVEYGFIPNLDNIEVGEFLDLENLMKDGKQLHKIAAILYRPITKKIGEMYQIEPYEGTSKYAETMKKINYKVAKGGLFFFINLLKALVDALNIYTEQMKQKKAKKKA